VISKIIIPTGRKALLGGSKDELVDVSVSLDEQVTGPYLCGETVTVADCAAFPFLWRINDEYG
jgi:glutathione S-transferase